MIKVEIKKENKVSHGATFNTQAEADRWIAEGMVGEWWGKPERMEFTGLGDPTGNILPAEYEVEQIDITAQIKQEKTNQEALDYLASTDWYIVRLSETGVSVPVDVLLKRAEARTKVVR